MSEGAITLLLHEARKAREGRDRWREVGPVLAELHAAGISSHRIQEETGIPHPTVRRIIRETTTRTGRNSPSTTGR